MRKVTITFLTDWEDEADITSAVLDIINGDDIADLLPESDDIDDPLRSVKFKVVPYKSSDNESANPK